MSFFLQDLKYAFKRLGTTPQFAFASVLTLALGIAAATNVFSLAHAVLIDPLPYESPATLMCVRWCGPSSQDCRWPSYSPSQILELGGRTDVFEDYFASAYADVVRTDGEQSEIVRGSYLTPNTFSLLGTRPILGRLPTVADVLPDASPVVLLSYPYWKSQFGGDETVLGRVSVLNDRPRIVIGVLPKRFRWQAADVYLPIQLTHGKIVGGPDYFEMFGRLKPGVTRAALQAKLKPVFNEFARALPESFRPDGHVESQSFQEMTHAGLQASLALLVFAALAFLTIACVNVSCLLLARAVIREKELAVRIALGASSPMLIRYAFADSLALVLCALPSGAVLAHLSLQATLAMLPPGYLPAESRVGMNLPFLAIAVAISLSAAILAAIGPAWYSARNYARSDLTRLLRADSLRPVQTRIQNGLMTLEIALSLVLVTIAGLFLHSSLELRSVRFPFAPENVLLLRIPLPSERFPDTASRNRFFGDLIERIKSTPGVVSVTVDLALPFFEFWSTEVRVPGRIASKRSSLLHATNSDYFSVFGHRIVRGRPFTEAEIRNGSRVLVVNQEFVHTYLNGEDPLDKSIHLVDLALPPVSLAHDTFQVVGIVADVRATLTKTEYPQAFIPYTLFGLSQVVAIQTATRPAIVARSVQQHVQALDKNQPITNVQTMDEALAEQGFAVSQFQMTLFGVFAALALLLMAVAVYGVVSTNVQHRRKEIAIRMALGASCPSLFWMVLRRALLFAAAGVSIGIPISLVTTRLGRFVLYAVPWHDPFAFLFAISTVVGVTSLIASFPAHLAARADPMEYLRHE